MRWEKIVFIILKLVKNKKERYNFLFLCIYVKQQESVLINKTRINVHNLSTYHNRAD